ncbi:DUF6519 domain-containing protein [Lysobacter yangpyeongensis]|uniref:DUF6519 domain-containing protein n=1 Tax=Lysobacter yangpyeongensis TaxID=346182 RepID=A0ABW0SKF2_9GAMM
MSGDFSRITFDPWDDDLGVLLQQGRPLSDAEWNALALQLRRRMQVDTLDTIGPAVVPLQTPDAFKLGFSGGNLSIGVGRMYVDGLLAQNHGSGTRTWDPQLEEEVGTQPVFYAPPASDPDAGQPYYPNPPALPTSGRHLVYLDVWTREVSHLVRPDLIEKAVGVDSTTRLQTVWQVKLLPNVGSTANCATPLDSIPGWLPEHAPSAARLTTTTAPVPGEPDPCLIPPGGGYKGLENQLYRIEIHKGGGLGTATFKWSRDNASVETRVTHIPALNQLVVESIGKDSVLRFSDGDWIEITDDWRELHNEPGELRRIRIGNGVDDATRTIVLEQPLPAGLFPTDAQNRTQPARHTRIKRWDQRGKVLDQNGALLQDLDLATATGEITVPASGAVSVLLEHNVIASFSLDPAGGAMKSGDAWVFAARSTDATIEELDAAPPLAIHHHYAKLGFVTFPTGLTDCRIFWPPPAGNGGGGGDKVDHCACTVCVTPAQHEANNPSIQDAIDKVIAAGGGTVCLQVGHYELREPLKIVGASSLRIVGKGWNTELVSDTQVFWPIEKCHDIGLAHFTALSRGGGDIAGVMLLREVESAQLEHLRIGAEKTGTGILLEGALSDLSIRDNQIKAFVGIGSGGVNAAGVATGLMDLRIEDNLFNCEECAISLADVTVHHAVSRIANNAVRGCRKAGFILTGASTDGSGVDIAGNSLQVMGDGMHVGMDGPRVADNNVAVIKQTGDENVGIRLVPGLTGDNGMNGCQLVGNRIADFFGGIELDVPLANAMIRRNEISGSELGLYTRDGVRIRELSILGNQFLRITGEAMRVQSFPMDDIGARLAVNANQIEVQSPRTGVQLVCRDGDVVFSDNQCLQAGAKDDPCIFVMADTIVAASNRLTAQNKASILLQPRMGRVPCCTVVGNITSGEIHVGTVGTALPLPWHPLNLMNV